MEHLSWAHLSAWITAFSPSVGQVPCYCSSHAQLFSLTGISANFINMSLHSHRNDLLAFLYGFWMFLWFLNFLPLFTHLYTSWKFWILNSVDKWSNMHKTLEMNKEKQLQVRSTFLHNGRHAKSYMLKHSWAQIQGDLASVQTHIIPIFNLYFPVKSTFMNGCDLGHDHMKAMLCWSLGKHPWVSYA